MNQSEKPPVLKGTRTPTRGNKHSNIVDEGPIRVQKNSDTTSRSASSLDSSSRNDHVHQKRHSTPEGVCTSDGGDTSGKKTDLPQSNIRSYDSEIYMVKEDVLKFRELYHDWWHTGLDQYRTHAQVKSEEMFHKANSRARREAQAENGSINSRDKTQIDRRCCRIIRDALKKGFKRCESYQTAIHQETALDLEEFVRDSFKAIMKGIKIEEASQQNKKDRGVTEQHQSSELNGKRSKDAPSPHKRPKENDCNEEVPGHSRTSQTEQKKTAKSKKAPAVKPPKDDKVGQQAVTTESMPMHHRTEAMDRPNQDKPLKAATSKQNIKPTKNVKDAKPTNAGQAKNAEPLLTDPHRDGKDTRTFRPKRPKMTEYTRSQEDIIDSRISIRPNDTERVRVSEEPKRVKTPKATTTTDATNGKPRNNSRPATTTKPRQGSQDTKSPRSPVTSEASKNAKTTKSSRPARDPEPRQEPKDTKRPKKAERSSVTNDTVTDNERITRTTLMETLTNGRTNGTREAKNSCGERSTASPRQVNRDKTRERKGEKEEK